jgi:integrase
LVDLPIRHVRPKQLADGSTAFYWEVPTKYRRVGCPLVSERLKGTSGEIATRADELNRSFDAWRTGDDQGSIIPGTIKWLRREYEKDEAFTSLKRKTRQTVGYCLDVIEEYRLESGRQFGDLRIADIARRHAKAMKKKLAEDRGQSLSNSVMRYARLLWNFAIDELELTIEKNPFQRMKLAAGGGKTYAPTRAEVEAFIAKADEMGYRSAGTAVMLAFEFCQRAGDVIGTKQDDGSVTGISWHDYRPPSEYGVRASLRVRQHKTGELIWVPLYDYDEATRAHFELFPGLIERLDATPRRGPLIIMRDEPAKRRKGTIYLTYNEYAFGHLFREIATAAGLPAKVQFRGMRHGGLTEMGDSEATDQEMMSLSGHTDRATLKVYSKRTASQARSGARKRLALRMDIEQSSERHSEGVRNADLKKSKKTDK